MTSPSGDEIDERFLNLQFHNDKKKAQSPNKDHVMQSKAPEVSVHQC